MQDAAIPFQLVNQQVDAAMESGQGVILARVISETSCVMRGVQDQWTRLVDVENKKMSERPDEVPSGLVWRTTTSSRPTTPPHFLHV
jgi:hypothetical protein